MSYTAYATVDEYEVLFPDAAAVTEADLRTASRHIDSMMFNRIVAAGFSNLTGFQQAVVKEVCCRQAKFETENADLLDNVLSSYSINGVSMGFGGDSWNMVTAHGVAMPRDVYALLQQTGLCCRIVG